MSQYDPFWRALADLQRIARLVGCQVSAVVVHDIPKPALPDWETERSARDQLSRQLPDEASGST